MERCTQVRVNPAKGIAHYGNFEAGFDAAAKLEVKRLDEHLKHGPETPAP